MKKRMSFNVAPRPSAPKPKRPTNWLPVWLVNIVIGFAVGAWFGGFLSL